MHKGLFQIIIQNSKKKNEGKPIYLTVGKLLTMEHSVNPI